MGMFDGIEQVTSSAGGQYVQPGKHRFRINALKQPPGLRSGNNFIAELVVVSSSYAMYEEGMRVSWVSNVTKGELMALAEIKNFLAAAAKCEESKITQAAAEFAVSVSQPYADVLVDCEAYHKPLKNKPGGVFTKTIWSPVLDAE